MNDLVLISGIPAAGKTSFGDYLRDNQRFLHVDLEALDGVFIGALHRSARVGRLEVFLEVLKRNTAPVVFTWGFHPEALDTVQALKKAGAELWWFDADEDAARQRFASRATVPVENFDAQVSRIRAARKQIEACFRPRVIQTLRADGNFLPSDKLFQIMSGRAVAKV